MERATAATPMSQEERARIIDRLKDVVATRPEVKLAYCHGSFVRGEPFRDIDVAVVLEEPFTWRIPGRVADEIAAATGPLPRPLDVVAMNTAPPGFRLRVAEEGVLLFERAPRDAIEHWVRAKSEVLDLETWHRVHGVGSR